MLYIPNNTYIDLRSSALRYNALLKELSYQSREIQSLKDRVASFNGDESRAAKRKLKKVIGHIIQLRDQHA